MTVPSEATQENNVIEERHPSLFFLTQYFQDYLARSEQVDPTTCSRVELFALCRKSSALRKFILDYIEEGYTNFTDSLLEETDALNRLEILQKKNLSLLGKGTERDFFYLYPQAIHLDFLNENDPSKGRVLQLNAYLAELMERSTDVVDIAPFFEDPHQMQLWVEKTQALMQEMVEFLAWTVTHLQKKQASVPVTLLRDTLLIHFGLSYLHQHGRVAKSPKPLFMSRKLVNTLTGSNKSYFTLVSKVLYKILLAQSRCDLAVLRAEFIRAACCHPDISDIFIQQSRNYLNLLELSESPPLLIETGLHGTFPLWILTLTENQGDFLLYTTAPWLSKTYQSIIFTENYNYLRDFETIILQDRLFQFEDYADGEVTVRETSNQTIHTLAAYELQVFMQLLRKKFSI